MQKLISALTVFGLFFPMYAAHAALSPLSVAIVPGVQFPPENFSVTGLRVSVLFGEHRDLYGIDFGVLGNITDLTFTGVAVSGLFNMTHGTTNAIGAQIAGVTNINTNKTHIYGLQLALGANVNTSESSLSGLAVAAVNLSPFMKVYGLQVGLFNEAQDVYGFQIGLVNRAKSLHGLQIGIVNFNETGTFYVSPVLNIGF